jgi:hypothetical protein
VSIVQAFPKRPLQLSGYPKGPSFGRLSAVAICCGIIVYPLYNGYSNAVVLIDEYRLHRAGMMAMQSEAENYHYSSHASPKNFGGTVIFDAHYVTEDGHGLDRHVEFDTAFEPEFKSAFLVRYDPASPERISTSWGAELLRSRTILVMLNFMLCLIMVAAAALGVSRFRRRRRDLAAIAAQPTPVEATLRGEASATYYYFWKDSLGRAWNGSFAFDRGQEPFWLDAAKTRLLALTGPDGESVLLDAALAWITLTEQERAEILNARAAATVRGLPPVMASNPTASNTRNSRA